MIYLKRTFHPVGQGAFFTEQFYDDAMENVLYNVVYDCGSLSRNIRTQFELEIRNCFHDIKKIDALFLSHFDNDHVNYVKYLKEHGYLKGTRIFVPMMEAEEWLGIRPYYTNFRYILSLNDPNEDGTKVIKVAFQNEEEQMSKVIEDIKEDIIPYGITLKHGFDGIIWCYVPFNVRFKTLIDLFKNLLTRNQLDYYKMRDADYVTKHIRDLRKIYRSLGEKPVRGTAINLNSLLVMSYPMNMTDCVCLGHRQMFRYYYNCQKIKWREGYSGSCLYTGDTSANDSVVWQAIEQQIKQCLGNNKKLMMLQVPHHGSKYSYDQNLVKSDKYIHGFTNYDPYYRQHVFDDNLPMKFAANDKILVSVTREYSSRFEAYYQLHTRIRHTPEARDVL